VHPDHQRQLLGHPIGRHVDRGAGHRRGSLVVGGHVEQPGRHDAGCGATGVALGTEQLPGRVRGDRARAVERAGHDSSVVQADAGEAERRAQDDRQDSSGQAGVIGVGGRPDVGQQAGAGDQQVHAQGNRGRQQRPIDPDHGQAAQHDPGPADQQGRPEARLRGAVQQSGPALVSQQGRRPELGTTGQHERNAGHGTDPGQAHRLPRPDHHGGQREADGQSQFRRAFPVQLDQLDEGGNDQAEAHAQGHHLDRGERADGQERSGRDRQDPGRNPEKPAHPGIGHAQDSSGRPPRARVLTKPATQSIS